MNNVFSSSFRGFFFFFPDSGYHVGEMNCVPFSQVIMPVLLRSRKQKQEKTSKSLTKQCIITILGQHSVQFSSVAQSCPTLCNPMYCSTPGLPVHHQLPEFTQTRIHRVTDAIQPSHPLSSPSPPAPNPSHHQSLFQ